MLMDPEPTGIELLALTTIETFISLVPVLLLPSCVVAVIVAVPLETAVTTPLSETVATLEFDDDQERAWSVAFTGVIVAVKVVVPPILVKVSVTGSVTLVTKIFAVTVTMQLSDLLLPSVEVAVMVAFPLETAVTTPLAETVATAAFEEDQASVLFVALPGATIAVNTVVAPIVGMVVVAGMEIAVTNIFTFTVTALIADL